MKSALTSPPNGNSNNGSEESYYTAPQDPGIFDFGKQFDALMEEGEIAEQDDLVSMSLHEVIETQQEYTHYINVARETDFKLSGVLKSAKLKDGSFVFGFGDLNGAVGAIKQLRASNVVCNFVRAGAIGLSDELCSRVVVAGIKDNIDASVLQANMSGFGAVHLIEKLDTMGSFVVDFCDYRDAAYAVENLNGKIIYGSKIRVVLWKDGTTLSDVLEGRRKLEPLPELEVLKPSKKPLRLSNLQMLNELKKRQSSGASSESDNSEHQVDLIKVLQGVDQRTTFMIRNIPNKYTQDMLVDLLDSIVFGTFDFLYLRMDYVNNCNCGYAFVNFKTAADVVPLITEIVGKKWPKFNSDKVGSVSYAAVQGLDALIAKFRDSSVMNEQEAYQPKLFKNGQPVNFPQPTAGGYRRLTLKSRK